MQKTLRKTISFPVGLVKDLEIIAFQYHMDFPDFMRYLGVKELQEMRSKEHEKVYYMSDATEKAIIEGEKEYEAGKTLSFKDGTSFFKYLRNKRKK